MVVAKLKAQSQNFPDPPHLRLGIVVPPQKGMTIAMNTSVSVAVTSPPGVAKTPASGGHFDRPQVFISSGLGWPFPPAQSRRPMDMMVQGCAASLFQA